MENRPKRKSGIKKVGLGDLFNPNASINFSEFTDPYADFQQEYTNLAKKKLRQDYGEAYIVTYSDDPTLLYVAFASNKDKAKSIATKYFRDSFYPTFMGTEWKRRYNFGRTRRMREWDIFRKVKKVPITELMRVGAKFPCSSCGSDNFTYQDYEDKRCFIIEDEGDLNPFTSGFVLCYNCYKKYIENDNK